MRIETKTASGKPSPTQPELRKFMTCLCFQPQVKMRFEYEKSCHFLITVNIMSDRSNPDPFVIQKSRTMNKRVKLNVGGIRHEIMWKVLECVPNSRLGMLAKVNNNEKRCQA